MKNYMRENSYILDDSVVTYGCNYITGVTKGIHFASKLEHRETFRNIISVGYNDIPSDKTCLLGYIRLIDVR